MAGGRGEPQSARTDYPMWESKTGFEEDEFTFVRIQYDSSTTTSLTAWEREGEDIEYFQKYSTKVSYHFGINIITYAMTH